MAVETKVFVPGRGPSKQPATVCCQDFAQALESGSDNEGYGPLIQFYGDGWHMGGGPLGPFEWCPWCGTHVSHCEVRGG